MDELRTRLAPLTDWMPSALRDRLDIEVWWLIFLTVALLVLLLIGLMLRAVVRRLFRRRDDNWQGERDLHEDLEACPLPTRPVGEHILYAYHVPVRLRLVIVSAPGKVADVDAITVEKLLERMVPGLGAIVARDRPRIRVWPPQLSQQGFVATFNRCTPKPEPEGQPSRWVLIAGRALRGGQPTLLGLGLWADEPNTIGRVHLEPQQWLDVLRLRPARG
jgi:hypothetical protein